MFSTISTAAAFLPARDPSTGSSQGWRFAPVRNGNWRAGGLPRDGEIGRETRLIPEPPGGYANWSGHNCGQPAF